MANDAMLIIPAEELFWAPLAKPLRRRQAMRFELEVVCPMPAEELHAICVPRKDGTAVLVGCRRSDAQEWAGRPEVEVVRPDSVPSWIDPGFDVAAINLLQGEHRSQNARKRARSMSYAVAAWALAISVVALVGIERRATSVSQQSGVLRETEEELSRAIFGESQSSLPLALRLEAEERVIAATLRSLQEREVVSNAATGLATALQAWEPHDELSVTSVEVSGDQLRVHGVAARPSIAQDAARVLSEGSVWGVSSPSVSRTREGYRYELRGSGGAE